MQAGNQFRVRSDKDTHFTGAIAQNAEERENIALPAAVGASGVARCRVRGRVVQSDENLAWGLYFWARNTFQQADLDLDTFLGFWEFVAGDGKRIAGAGQWYYYVDGLDIPYEDLDATGQLHVSLVNRSAAAKTAGAGGEVVVVFTLEPTLGW